MQNFVDKKQTPLNIKTSVHHLNVSAKVQESNKDASQKNNEQNIEKVREILFGSQLKEHDRQIIDLESKNKENLNDLRQNLLGRLDDFEMLFKNEIKNLNYRLKGEQESRLQLEDKNQTELAELRSLMLKRAQQFNEDLRASKNLMTLDFKKEIKLLDQQKIERAQFAEFMTDWAQRFGIKAEDQSGTSK